RYVMDHSAGNVYFYLPDVPDTGGPFELLGSDSIMIPRYQNLSEHREPYLRGFGLWGGIQRLPVPDFLRKHKDVAVGFRCARWGCSARPRRRSTTATPGSRSMPR